MARPPRYQEARDAQRQRQPYQRRAVEQQLVVEVPLRIVGEAQPHQHEADRAPGDGELHAAPRLGCEGTGERTVEGRVSRHRLRAV